MEISGKFWGQTSPIFCRNNVEIHRIVGKKEGYSSEHKHESKYNMFFVEKGIIEIVTWKDDSGLPDITRLEEGQTCVIPPGKFHQFIVIENCIVYEIYWVECRPDDIKRRTRGGKNHTVVENVIDDIDVRLESKRVH